MDIIIICIDRDNDLGEKANIKTPIIGRYNNLNAAIKLALSDPEDSDANTIFGGIKIFDELKLKNIKVEIISLAGDKNIGVVSDKKISFQLDNFLEKNNFKSAIVVSDGAEDELILPIIQSRIKIDFIKRVVVIQSEKIERTYYILKKIFNNPKIVQTFFMPLGIIFITFSVLILFGYSNYTLIFILLLIGIYLLFKSLNIENILYKFQYFFRIKNIIKQIKKTLSFNFFLYLISIFIFIIGVTYCRINILNLKNIYLYWNFIEIIKIAVIFSFQKLIIFFCLSLILVILLNKKY